MNFVLLLATLAALLSGPLLYAVARPRPALLAFLDGFVLVSIAGLVLLEVVPVAFSEGGWWSAAFLLAGLIGPTLVERLMRRARREAHLLALTLAIAGLVVHSLADGAALAPAVAGGHTSLALAVAIHSIPVGLVVWWLMYPVFGALLPSLAIAAMCAGTLAGYAFGIEFAAVLGRQSWAWFSALVAGSILHVVFGRPHLEEDSVHHNEHPPYEGLGNLAALGALLLLGGVHFDAATQADFGQRFVDLALQAAPALLLAYLAGGFFTVELLQRRRRWLGGGATVSHALRGTVLGLPLAIRSSAVLPAYRSLIQGRAPPAAGIALLIATPAAGLVAMFISLPLLGAEYTLLRLAAVAMLAVLTGCIVARFAPASAERSGHDPQVVAASADAPAPRSGNARLRDAVRHGFIDLVDGSAPWLLAGFAIAALAVPWLQGLPWAQLPDALEVLAFALIGIPLYVCAAGATPLAAVLIVAGVSPGAAIAFLLTGPALNPATFGTLRELHGERAAILFAAVTALGAIALGIGISLLGPTALPPVADAHAPAGSPLAWASLALLTLLYVAALLRKGGRGFIDELLEPARAS